MGRRKALQRSLAIFTGLTGVFAIAGSLYSWGRGPLWSTTANAFTHLMITDLILTAPLSIVAAIGLYRRSRWGKRLSVFVAGIYAYGSIGVYVILAVNGPPYSVLYVIPAAFGLVLGAGLVVNALARSTVRQDMNSQPVNHAVHHSPTPAQSVRAV